jgi:hypothetical protein
MASRDGLGIEARGVAVGAADVAVAAADVATGPVAAGVDEQPATIANAQIAARDTELAAQSRRRTRG